MIIKTAMLCSSVLLALSSSLGFAATQTVGRVYPISETDALTEIELKASSVDVSKHVVRDAKKWSASKSMSVPKAFQSASRSYKPFYTLEMDITDANGKVIYPRGYKFNPLEFAHLPNRIVVISEAEVGWAKSHVDATTIVLLTDGDRVNVAKELKRSVFLLDQKTKDRLSIRYVPSIVQQKADYFQINEFYLERS